MILEAKKEDVPYIVKLEIDTLGSTLGEDLLVSYLDNSLAKIFVFKNDDLIIGYISTVFDGSVCEILNICIKNDYQNKGNGKLLLGYILKFYNYEAKSFFLEVRASNKRAIKLYEYFDFKQIHIRKNYYKTEDALVLERKVLEYKDLKLKLIEPFCKKNTFEGFTYFYDDANMDRYTHNFFLLENRLSSTISSIKEYAINNSLNHIEIYSFWDDYILDGFEVSKEVSMYGMISSIHIIKDPSYKAYIATNSDIEQLTLALYNDDVKYGVSYATINLKQVIKSIENGFYNYVFVKDSNEIIGYARFIKINRTIYFEDFEVKEKFRNKGVGSSIFNKVIEYAILNNFYDIYLDADYDDTYKFMYEKMGFVQGKVLTIYGGKSNGKN